MRISWVWSDRHGWHCSPDGGICEYCKEMGGYSWVDRLLWMLRKLVHKPQNSEDVVRNRLEEKKNELYALADEMCSCDKAWHEHDWDNDCFGDSLHLMGAEIEMELEKRNG